MNLNFREMKISKAFTLVEMLIVVVIIGILSSALIPRLTGYLARTRDMKRQADLRNIAAAIEMYRNEYGEFPILRKEYVYPSAFNMAGSASLLSESLSEYLKNIPMDPSKNSYVDVFSDKYDHRFSVKNNKRLLPGEYLYQLGVRTRKTAIGSRPDFVLLVAKMETPAAANYIIFNYDAGTNNPGYAWYYYNTNPSPQPDTFSRRQLSFCNEIKKGDTPQFIPQADGRIVCEYTAADQLYYILKIE